MLINDLINELREPDSWVKKVNTISYHKTLGELIVDCHHALSNKDPFSVYLHLPRLMRVMIDNYSSNIEPTIQERLNIEIITDIVLKSFNNYKNGLNALNSIKIPLRNNYTVYEQEDYATRVNSNPFLINEFAKKLKEYLKDETISLVSLGNGATRPCLLMMPLIADHIVDYVPFRFSCYKHKDLVPHLIEYDLNRLKNKRLLIFDDDRSTGHNLQNCKNYLLTNGLVESNLIFGTISTSVTNPENVIPELYVIKT